MVPGTSNGIADDDPVSKLSPVMRALGTYREDIVTLAREENRLVTGMSFKQASICEAREGDAGGEVRAFRALRRGCHG
jgi:hypothetical protein